MELTLCPECGGLASSPESSDCENEDCRLAKGKTATCAETDSQPSCEAPPDIEQIETPEIKLDPCDEVLDEPVDELVFCHHCGEKYVEDARYCSYCGTPKPRQPQEQPQEAMSVADTPDQKHVEFEEVSDEYEPGPLIEPGLGCPEIPARRIGGGLYLFAFQLLMLPFVLPILAWSQGRFLYDFVESRGIASLVYRLGLICISAVYCVALIVSLYVAYLFVTKRKAFSIWYALLSIAIVLHNLISSYAIHNPILHRAITVYLTFMYLSPSTVSVLLFILISFAVAYLFMSKRSKETFSR